MLKVIKYSGEKEPFSDKKFISSLKDAKIPEDHIDQVVKIVKKDFESPIKTQDLYKKTFDILKNIKHSEAARYSLKHALLELGPTGYPFEQLIGRIYEKKGYKVEVGRVLKGECISHEIDVVAYKSKDDFLIIECKFYNRPGIFLGVQTPMYMESRFNDIYSSTKTWKGYELKHVSQCVIATNTKFSTQSIEFAQCKDMKLLGWKHPKNEGIEYLLEKYNLYPITTLPLLTKEEREKLLKSDIVLCNEIENETQKMIDLGFSKKRIDEIIKECHSVRE